MKSAPLCAFLWVAISANSTSSPYSFAILLQYADPQGPTPSTGDLMNPSIGYQRYARNRDPLPEGVPKEWWNEKFPSDLTKLIGMFWFAILGHHQLLAYIAYNAYNLCMQYTLRNVP